MVCATQAELLLQYFFPQDFSLQGRPVGAFGI